LRVLLPPELENWTIDVFGFIPKRYDSTLLDIAFPGETAPRSGPSSPIRCCTPISAISFQRAVVLPSQRTGAAFWRGQVFHLHWR